jgi:hypothetical protein
MYVSDRKLYTHQKMIERPGRRRKMEKAITVIDDAMISQTT